MHSPKQSLYIKYKDCPICYETINTITPLKCGNWNHNKCIKKWSLLYHKHNLCLTCKFKIKKSNISSNKFIKKFEKDFIQRILFKLLSIPL
jgi:hypothetical protein